MPQGLIRAVEEIARPLPRPESPTLTKGARIAHFLGLTAKQKRATLRERCGFLFETKADLAASCSGDFKRSCDMADLPEIMVVEDDQSVQSLVEEALSEGGSETALASSGEEALPLLGRNKSGVLVIDIKLGKDRIKGWDIARRARAINPGLPIIYITGADAQEWAVQGVPDSSNL